MTKQEIQALIDAKIAGQGSAVDAGGALPKILHEILEAAFAGQNVQSNWNENDSQSPQYIQNKPTIPAAQVQSDWEQDDNTKSDFIKNKPTIPQPYELPVASAEVLGGVKVGLGLSIAENGRLFTKELEYEVLNPPQNFQDKTAAEVAALGIDGLDTELKVSDFYQKAMIGDYKRFGIYGYTLIWGGLASASSDSTVCSFIGVASPGDAGAITAALYLTRSGIPAKYSWHWTEV